jgi:urease subunit beta
MSTINQPGETRGASDCTTDVLVPGQTRLRTRSLKLTDDPTVVTVLVSNTSTRPFEIASDCDFSEVASELEFDRDTARGMRLNGPPGTAVRFEPGDTRAVDLVAIE